MLDRLRKLFDRAETAEERLAGRWRKHANRRTLSILIVLAAVAWYGYHRYLETPADFPVNSIITIPSGLSLSQIGIFLEENRVVRSAQAFEALAILSGHRRDLRAGDYFFRYPLDVFRVEHVVALGAYGLEPIKVTVVDGATVQGMAAQFSSLLPRFDSAGFLAKAQPLEGFLFPDTYYFLPNATEDTVIQAMRQNFDAQEETIDPQVEGFGHSLRDDVIMASIVEKEARTMEDRRMIAGVLWNRIDKGMPLQTDVPLVYITGKSDFELTRADLATTSPYNTYVRKGLPIGPIDSPSLDALLAAVTPIRSDYLFYLADAYGITHYSDTYKEQLANQAKYLGN